MRLRYAYFVTCREVVKNASGEIVELRCTYDPETRGGNAPDGRKVRGTIHWVSAAHAVPAEIRLYNPLFTRPDPGAEGDLIADLNPDSLEILHGAMVEPALAADNADETVQFERQGYFRRDPDSTPGRLVFNRTIALRDTWAQDRAGQAGRSAQTSGSLRSRNGRCGGLAAASANTAPLGVGQQPIEHTEHESHSAEPGKRLDSHRFEIEQDQLACHDQDGDQHDGACLDGARSASATTPRSNG